MIHWRYYFEPPETRPHWEWCEEFVEIKSSPLGKKFNSTLTPWLREPMQEMPDNRHREGTAMCCVQGGKTTLLKGIALRAMRFDPGNMFITCQTNEDAKEFAKEDFNYSISKIPELASKIPKDRAKQSICNISMPDMFLKIQGANKSNLQSKPVRWIFNDEVYLWKRGLLDEARKRGTRYWNRHVLNFSTAGESGCDLDLAFIAGDQREWHHRCPECNKLNNPKWERIRWPKDESVKRAGEWDFQKLKEATYFECEHCSAHLQHTERNHRLMNAGGAYIAMNPNPTPGHISFHWNALCLPPSTLSWGDLAVEWVKAEIEFNKGNEAPRKEFITKRLAESYEDNRYAVYTKLPMVKAGNRPDEAFRFLTVDVQEAEFWAVVRAWSKTGESWLIWAGKLLSYEEIESKAKAENVPAACVFIDCSYDTRKVYLECAKRNEIETIKGRREWVGWKALNGEAEARKSFVFRPAKGAARLLPYSYPGKYVDPMMGMAANERRYAKMFLWSNIAIKDILARLRDKKGARWVGYEGVCEDWHKHMFSERRVRVYKSGQDVSKWEPIGKRPNHLWDCECMQVVAACMAEVIGGEFTPDEPIKEEASQES